jgi:hypothetical protein
LGSRGGVRFCPRVVVQCVGFEGGAPQHRCRGRRVEVGLKPLPEWMQLLTGAPPRAGEASCRLALRHPTPSQHPGGRALPGVREDRPGQSRVVSLTGPTAVGGEMALGTDQAPLGAATVRALQALRVERPFEPKHTDAIIQSLVDWKVYHMVRIPHPAR